MASAALLAELGRSIDAANGLGLYGVVGAAAVGTSALTWVDGPVGHDLLTTTELTMPGQPASEMGALMGSIVLNMSVSLDGFSAGPDVAVERPMGEGGERLHEWLFTSDSDQAVAADGTSPDRVDAQVAQELSATTGAVVVGRRTFDVGVDIWADTPFPVPCFVLTHEPCEQRVMKSAAFTFVTDGIESALTQARAAAADRNVLVMGGAHTAQQFIRAGLIDEVQIQLVPVLLGAGVRLFDHLGTHRIELERTVLLGSPHVTHLRFRVLK